jgi:hypothetical protein
MEDIPLLYFNHMWGVSRWDIQHLPELKNKIKVGAKINTDIQRNVAVWMEFVDYPFFGTQFHPEKEPMSGANPFDQKRDDQIGTEDEGEEEEDEIKETKNVEVQILGDYKDTVKKQQVFFNFALNQNGSDNNPEKENDKNFSDDDTSENSKEDESTEAMDFEPEEDIHMKNVHVAVRNEKLSAMKNTQTGGGVDSIAPPIVSDPSLISEKYLHKVKKINQKFAELFASFMGNGKFEVESKFLEKQLYWLENIGSYYQVNVIRDKD